MNAFISYRRSDSAVYAAWLNEELSARLGREHVFMDVDGIEPGEDFVTVLEGALEKSDVFFAVIGSTWLSATDNAGHRRLDDPGDYVRLEVAAALRRGIRVIPVLVHGATIPAPDQLPADLEALSRRQAVSLSDTRFAQEARAFIRALDTSSAGRPTPGVAVDWEGLRRRAFERSRRFAASLDRTQVAALTGSAILFLGLFAPAVEDHDLSLRSQTLYSFWSASDLYDQGVGFGQHPGYLLVLSLITAVLALFPRTLRGVWVSGGLAAIVLLYDLFFNAIFPWGGLSRSAAASYGTLSLQWGWIVMLVGVGLIIASPFLVKAPQALSPAEPARTRDEAGLGSS